MIRGRRFLDEHVERGSCYLAGFQRVGKRSFIDDSATRTVDDPHSLLHLRERSCADDAPGVVSQRSVDGDEVGVREKLVKADQLNADATCGISGQNWIVADHFHLESDRTVRDDAPDVTEANDAERLVAYLGAGEFGAIPFS